MLNGVIRIGMSCRYEIAIKRYIIVVCVCVCVCVCNGTYELSPSSPVSLWWMLW
jgi:hypothetical protein